MGTKIGVRLACLTSAIAIVCAIIGGTAPVASACSNAEHCYGIAEFDGPADAFAGDTTAIQTSYAVVREWQSRFFTNEMWACSSGYKCGYWVEAGDIDGRGVNGLRYFVAYNKPSTGFVFAEYPNSPGSGAFPVDIHALPGGTFWWLNVGGQPAYGVAEMPPYSNILEAGLEETENSAINWGYAGTPLPLDWYDPVNGVQHESWQGYGKAAQLAANRPACVKWNAPYTTIYFVANNCSFTSTVAAPLPIVQSPAVKPGEGYVAPTGAELTEAQLRSVARHLASEDGDSSPREITVTHADRRDAMAALDATSTIPSSSQAPALAPWLGGASVLIMMHGHFAPSVPKPDGSPAIVGTMLSAVVDARTGRLSAFSVSDEGPSSRAIEALGGAKPLS